MKTITAQLLSGFEVEWCDTLPSDEFGDADLDKAHYTLRSFARWQDALEYAISVYPKTEKTFGAVLIHWFDVVPLFDGAPAHATTKEYREESAEYSGADTKDSCTESLKAMMPHKPSRKVTP